MALDYPGEWKFDGIGESIPPGAIDELHELLLLTASGAGFDNTKKFLERFKSAFGRKGWSTNTSFAESDLKDAMAGKADNAAFFVDSLWAAIESVQADVAVPSADRINKVLLNHAIPLKIDPPSLLLVRGDVAIVDAATDDTSSSQPIYVKGDVIGHGGFGVVYKVSRTTAISEFHYAMKVLDPSSFNENKERAAARFKREIEALKMLQHRGIVPIIEAGLEQEGKPYILMPLIEGTRLRDALSGCDLLSLRNAFCEILRALDYAHSAGVIHRDLKPSNVMIRSSDQQPIILDFGCAYLFDAENEESLSSKYFGTTAYIPAEVIRDPKQRSTLHDVYACGVTLYEVAAGALPDPDDYDPLERVNPTFAVLDPIIRDAIAPAKRRIISAVAFLSRLEEVSV
jgi:hypothetical protein